MRHKRERIAPLSGAVCVIAVMVGNGMALAGQTGATGGAGLLADLQAAPSLVNSLGLTLEMFGWAALMCFLAVLYRTLRGAEHSDGWLASVAFGAGVLMLALKLGSVAPWMAAWYRRDELTVPLAQTLNDLGAALFIVSGWATGLCVAAAAGSAIGSRVLPRWLGWFGLVSGVGALVAGTAGVVNPQTYNPMLFLASLLWVLLTSVVLAVRAGHAPKAEHQADTVPAGAAAGQ